MCPAYAPCRLVKLSRLGSAEVCQSPQDPSGPSGPRRHVVLEVVGELGQKPARRSIESTRSHQLLCSFTHLDSSSSGSGELGEAIGRPLGTSNGNDRGVLPLAGRIAAICIRRCAIVIVSELA